MSASYRSAGDARVDFSVAALRKACRELPAPRRQSVVVELDAPKRAAVLVPLRETPEGLGVVITRRAASLRHHGDDWVFPGGGLDPDDASASAAAVREASEELGVAARDFELLGQLDSRGPILTGYVIDVFVALVDSKSAWRPDTSEVEEVVTVPLWRLAAPGSTFRAPMPSSHDPGPLAEALRVAPDRSQELLHFVIRPGEHLWGLQAEILVELLGHLDAAAAERQSGSGTRIP